jgi:light-regulated signal transduction histidine kinase (bacteriophytochrome)
MDETLFFEIEHLKHMFNPSPNKSERSIQDIPKNVTPDEREPSLLFPILINLIHLVKSTFRFINNFAQVSRDKFSDKEFGDYFVRTVTEDTKKIDLLLECILDYIKVSTPIRKVNTVHAFIEELLKKRQGQLEEKNIRLFKRFEKDLPEAAVPEEQLRYVLNAILQYAIALIPFNGSIGFCTRSFFIQKEMGEDQASLKKGGKYVEISILFTGSKKTTERIETVPQIAGDHGELLLSLELVMDLELRLIDEIAKRNQGVMKVETDEEMSKTSITLRFPVERRKMVYHQPMN